jgi:hypothetical protein
MAKKKQFLVIENEIDFILIGIVSHAKDYRLCFDLNKLLEILLEKGEDLELKNKNTESSFFSVFSYTNEDDNKMIIISNKSAGQHLIQELKQWDYFFMIKGLIREAEKTNILEKIKSSKLVTLMADIEASKVKSIGNLIF